VTQQLSENQKKIKALAERQREVSPVSPSHEKARIFVRSERFWAILETMQVRYQENTLYVSIGTEGNLASINVFTESHALILQLHVSPRGGIFIPNISSSRGGQHYANFVDCLSFMSLRLNSGATLPFELSSEDLVRPRIAINPREDFALVGQLYV
jgi:hypothetical protein